MVPDRAVVRQERHGKARNFSLFSRECAILPLNTLIHAASASEACFLFGLDVMHEQEDAKKKKGTCIYWWRQVPLVVTTRLGVPGGHLVPNTPKVYCLLGGL